MTTRTLEVAYIPLKPGLDLTTTTGEGGDANANAAAAWQASLATIAAQSGVQSVFWGRQVERQDVVQLVVGTWFGKSGFFPLP